MRGRPIEDSPIEKPDSRWIFAIPALVWIVVSIVLAAYYWLF